MKRELKVYAATFCIMLFLGAAAPIALNGGGVSGFDGGSFTGQALAIDGTVSAPGLSFAGDTNNGMYYASSNVLGMSVGGTAMSLISGTTSSVLSTTSARNSGTVPDVRTTDSDTGIGTVSTGIRFIWNGTEFASMRYDATSLGKMCLDQAADTSAPCFSLVGASANMGLVTLNSAAYTGNLDMGSGTVQSNSASAQYPSITTTGTNTMGLYGNGSNAFALSVFATRVADFAVGASSDGYVQNGTGSYVRITEGAGAPTAGHCDADAERGRLYLDTTNDRLYVCDSAASGWGYVALTD